jgi:DNA (cytosine-5)-methyltransferase 1
MENVPNMLRLAQGHFEEKVIRAFKRAGYSNVTHRILDAADYGVPQSRRRLFFFGSLDSDSIEDMIDGRLKASRRRRYSVSQAIGDLPEEVSDPGATLSYPGYPRANKLLDDLRLDRDGGLYASKEKTRAAGGLKLYNHHTKGIQARRLRLIKKLKPGARGDSLPHAYRNDVRPHKWRRLAPGSPAHTILAQMHRDLSEWVHPNFDRWITVREAARLQSFHDGFVFETSEYQMLKQVGNAVPPLLGKAVASVALPAP